MPMAILLAQERGLELAEGGQGRQGEEARVGGNGECGGRERERESRARAGHHRIQRARRAALPPGTPSPIRQFSISTTPQFSSSLSCSFHHIACTDPRRRALDLRPRGLKMASTLGIGQRMQDGPSRAWCLPRTRDRAMLRSISLPPGPQVRLSRISIPARRLASSKARCDPPACTRSRPVHRSWDHGSTLGGPLSSGRDWSVDSTRSCSCRERHGIHSHGRVYARDLLDQPWPYLNLRHVRPEFCHRRLSS